MRLGLALLLLCAAPLHAQEDKVSSKRLESLEMLKKLRSVTQGKEKAELIYRSAVLLEEEADSKQTPELAAPYRTEARALFQSLVDDFPAHARATEARARLRVPVKAPSGAVLTLDEALHAARVDFDQQPPLPSLPAGMDVTLTCCVETNVLGAPVGVVITLSLPPFPDAPGAERPTTSLGGYSVSVSGEAKVLRRPDFTQLRSTAVAKATAAQRAVSIAHAKLMTLEASAPWRARGGGYSTSLVAAAGQTWNVNFHAPDESFQMTVDLARGAVTHATIGAAARPLP
jgi:hypothetical protein